MNTETDRHNSQIKKLSQKLYISTSIPKQKGLHSFTGAVFITGNNTANSIICRSKKLGIITP